MVLRGQHLMGGHWRTGPAASLTRRPSDLNDVVGEYPLGCAQEAEEALVAAQVFFYYAGEVVRHPARATAYASKDYSALLALACERAGVPLPRLES